MDTYSHDLKDQCHFLTEVEAEEGGIFMLWWCCSLGLCVGWFVMTFKYMKERQSQELEVQKWQVVQEVRS